MALRSLQAPRDTDTASIQLSYKTCYTANKSFSVAFKEGASQNHLLAILWARMGVASNGCSPLTNRPFVYLEEASYVKAHIIHTAGPLAQLHVGVAGELF